MEQPEAQQPPAEETAVPEPAAAEAEPTPQAESIVETTAAAETALSAEGESTSETTATVETVLSEAESIAEAALTPEGEPIAETTATVETVLSEAESIAEAAPTPEMEPTAEAAVVAEKAESVGEATIAVGLIAKPVKKREGKVDITPKGEIRFYATGRRKESVARVWLIPGGTGQILVNGRPLFDYLCRISLSEHVLEPLRVTKTLGMFDVKATTSGGGLTGQAGALRHGIARALVVWNEELRPALRRYGLLTRDPRAKERKKYGYKRARRGFQFRKR